MCMYFNDRNVGDGRTLLVSSPYTAFLKWGYRGRAPMYEFCCGLISPLFTKEDLGACYPDSLRVILRHSDNE